MTASSNKPWSEATDDALVRRLIGAMQRATATELTGADEPATDVTLAAPEMATALLNLLASVLEAAPTCRTPMDMRLVSEAAGRELLTLMRGYREIARAEPGEARH